MKESLPRAALDFRGKDVVSLDSDPLSNGSGRAVADLTVSSIHDATEFAGMKGEWDSLIAQSNASPVFLSWAWLFTWWSVFGCDANRLNIVCIRDRNQLIGILPLYTRRKPWPSTKKLMFLGTGEGDADEVATEYLDIIVAKNYESIGVEAALVYLHQTANHLRFEFQRVLEDSLLAASMRRGNRFWHICERDEGSRYRIDLDNDFSKLPMAEHRLKRIKRSLRAVERDGGFTQVGIEDFDQLTIALDDVAHLSDERQTQLKRSKSAFASNKFYDFHRRLLPLLYQSNSADIQHFFLGNDLVASLYCFYDEQACHYYQSGFARSAANRYMPLTVAHLMEIERNRHQGKRYYDFMRGKPGTYKEDFNCEQTPMLTIVRYSSRWDRWASETYTILRKQLVAVLRGFGVSRRRE